MIKENNRDKNIKVSKRSIIFYIVIVISISVFIVISGSLSSSFVLTSSAFPLKIKQIVAHQQQLQQQSSNNMKIKPIVLQQQQSSNKQQQLANYPQPSYTAITTLPPPPPNISTYPTKENDYKCQNGPYKGFFVGSPELCDNKQGTNPISNSDSKSKLTLKKPDDSDISQAAKAKPSKFCQKHPNHPKCVPGTCTPPIFCTIPDQVPTCEGVTCPIGQPCIGTCDCPASTYYCPQENRCASVLDVLVCPNACQVKNVCGDKCDTPPENVGKVSCNGQCVDPNPPDDASNNANHCGPCGVQCQGAGAYCDFLEPPVGIYICSNCPTGYHPITPCINIYPRECIPDSCHYNTATCKRICDPPCTPSISPQGILSPQKSDSNKVTIAETGIECNGQCVDPNSDNQNCGGCTTETENRACTGGQTCQGGSCQCPDGQTACGNPVTCVDTSSDESNCGGCTTETENRACTNGQTCQGGSCQTPQCNTPCESYQVCRADSSDPSGSSCQQCPEGQFVDSSGTTCVSSCGPNEVVQKFDIVPGGHCVACPEGQSVCSPDGIPICVDTNTDIRDCGSCGNQCREPPVFGHSRCESGSCDVGCLPLETECPYLGDPLGRNVCVTLQDDENNCGACGNQCASNALCIEGVCVH